VVFYIIFSALKMPMLSLKYDLFGYALLLVVWGAAIMTFNIIPLIYLNLDPFYSIFSLFPAVKNLETSIILPIRIVIQLYAIFSGIRLGLSVIFVTLIGLCVILRCLFLFETKLSKKRNLPLILILLLDFYSRLFVTFKSLIMDHAGPPMGLAFISGAFFCTIIMSFSCIRFYFICPIKTYVLGVLFFMFILVGFHFSIPRVIYVFENTCEFLRVSNVIVNSNPAFGPSQKYLSKRLWSFMPCFAVAALGGFTFFKVTNSARLSYYELVFSHSLNLLLCIPQSAVRYTLG